MIIQLTEHFKTNRFTLLEVEQLVQHVEENRSILYGNHDSNVNNEMKRNIWRSIATKMEGVSLVPRQWHQLKKKRDTLFNKIKAKVCLNLQLFKIVKWHVKI